MTKKNKPEPPPSDYHHGSAATTPYPASRLAPAYGLVDMAHEISIADQQIQNRTNAKLQVIAEQIRNLQQQAQTILETARQDQTLHQAQCNFTRRAGETYHLYQRTNGQHYFSMLSPEDWGSQPPHTYIGSYRLENDMSWTDLADEKAVAEDLISQYVQALNQQD